MRRAGRPRRPVHDAVGPRVAIVIRVPEQFAARIEQTVVAAPRVDTDAVQATRVTPEPLQRALHLEPQLEDVPVQRPMFTDRLVDEAADLREVEHAGPEAPRHCAAAFRTEIERQELGTHCERRDRGYAGELPR